MAIYSADLETTTKAEDCRCWAWGFSDIEHPENVVYGNMLDGLMVEMQNRGGVFYFHNLKFDGNFIVYWLLTNGYTWTKESKKMNPGQFTTLISDMGTWYTITMQMKPTKTGITNKVEIRDSLKIIPLPVEEIPKAYGLEENKLELDYNKHREIGHKLTDDEILYLSHDIIIVAKALKFMFEHAQTKLTAGANALNDFKSRYDKKEYNKLFPKLSTLADSQIRQSYKGGWTYLNPLYKNKDIKEGSVYDVNSMYPWAMMYCLLPYGEPYYFVGEYKESKNYPLYVINFLAEFKLKPGKFPSIQLKHSQYYAENEYIEESLIPTVLTLTSVDFELFKHNYDYTIYEYYGGYMFRGKTGIFTDYIEYWYKVKSDSKRDGNHGMEKIAKLMLNSLYGKFGARTSGYSKIPYYDEQLDKVRYKKSEIEERKGGYIPIATFITSYCRDKIIRAAEKCGNRFIYADTDSVHILGNESVPGLDVDEYRLGAFKLEERFIRGKFIRQKTYLEIYKKGDKETKNLKCCGMPRKMKDSIDEKEFYEGAIYNPEENSKYAPKLVPMVVSGGVILKETTFQIKKTRTMEKSNIIIEGEEYEIH